MSSVSVNLNKRRAKQMKKVTTRDIDIICGTYSCCQADDFIEYQLGKRVMKETMD